jgi:hypothetical protein
MSKSVECVILNWILYNIYKLIIVKMQFMINKFNFKFATDSAKSEAYSPFAQVL